MKKKVLSWLLTTVVALSLFFGIMLNASAAVEGNWTYTLYDGDTTAAITGYSGADMSITIPSSIAGVPVTRIESDAFKDKATITEVVIPDSVLSIGNNAFLNSTLTSVALGEGVTYIGQYAFNGTDLTSVTIPNSVETIDVSAFALCDQLSSVTIIGNNLSSLGYGAFSGTAITEFRIPTSLLAIPESGFFDCNALESVTIPSTVTSIGNNAFGACELLSSATFEGNAPTMGNWVFNSAAADFIIYYYSLATGFDTPTWTTGLVTYNTSVIAPPDTTAPVLSGNSVWRSEAATASIRFISDEAGAYYYQVTDGDTPPSVGDLSGWTEGGSVLADTTVAFSPEGLTTGAKYVHIVLKDSSDNVSEVLTVALPYNLYYFDDFEAYASNAYPANYFVKYDGASTAEQKVISSTQADTATGNVFRLKGQSSWASDQRVTLPSGITGVITLEFDVKAVVGLGGAVAFGQNNVLWTGGIARVEMNNGIFRSIIGDSTITASAVTYELGSWYHVVLELDNTNRTFNYYVNGTKVNSGALAANAAYTLDYFGIGAGNSGSGDEMYYDNVKVYNTIAFSGGSGTEADPYQISTEDDLFEFAQKANDGDTFTGKYFEQINDITLTQDWTSIDEFNGSYDGQYYTIKGLVINNAGASGDDIVGFFGETDSNAVLTRINIVDANVIGDSYVGVLVGYNYSAAISGCFTSGTITGNYYTGGLVGCNEYGSISNCSSACQLSGNNDAGGLVGSNYNASISGCFASGDVTGEYRVGGLVGYNDYYAPISNCYVTGSVTGSADGSDYIGGLVGYNYRSCPIIRCYTTGNVSGNDGVGGLAGYNDTTGSMTECYTVSSLLGEFYVSPLAGYSYGSISRCYYLDNVSGNSTGPGLTADAMKLQASFVGWDFIDNWQIGVDGAYDYPTLGLGGAIRSTVGMGGDITPLGITDVAVGDDQAYSIVPNVGYVISDVKVNGVSIGDVSSYTFTDVQTSHTIEASFETAFNGGIGTELDPYQVATAEQLDNVRGYLDSYFIQTEDIDLTDYLAEGGDGYNLGAGWEPIGTEANPFTGCYDGNDMTISNLTIDSETGFVGLFGNISDAVELKDITLADITVAGVGSVGGLVGSNEGSIENCFAEGSVTGSGRYVGGLVGHNLGTISGGGYEGTVSGSDYKVGGLVGRNRGFIEDVTIDNVQVTGVEYAGGLVGRNLPQVIGGSGYDMTTGFITNCHVGANVTVNGSNSAGGLVGDNTSGIIEKSSSQATVTGTFWVGGFVGANSGTVRECMSSGTVTGSEALNGGTGGLIGYNDETVENCYSFASVTGPYKVGGLVGRNSSNVTNCYSAGPVTGTGSAIEVGGLIGVLQSGTVTNCYWDVETSTKNTSAAGTGYSTAAMKTQSTFVDWDFSEIWTISATDNNGYPALVCEDSEQTVSSDATLSGLAASGIALTPDFSSEVTSYSADVSNSVSSTTITATPSVEASSVTINGTAGTSKSVSLSVGSNTVTVIVTAQDGITTKTYSIVIDRADSGFVGGGSSYTPPTIVVTTDEDGPSIINSTEVSSTLTNGAASCTVSTKIVDALLDKISSAGGSDKGDLIEVAVDTQEAIDELKISILQSDLQKIVEETDASLAISSPFISITFDDKAIETISGAASGGSIVITAGVVDSSTLSQEDRERVQGRPVYNFTVSNGGQQVSDFAGGTATVTIPYSLQPGEDPNAVVVYYLADDGTLQSVSGKYDTATGSVVFTTTHFSKFIVGYHLIDFSDVAPGAWYEEAVTFLAARDIAAGIGDGRFSPQSNLTRGQFIVLLLRSYGIAPAENPADNFADAGDTWYTGYLAAAKELGISNGVGNNLFNPNAEINRQEMFTLLYRMLSTLNALPEETNGGNLLDFSDEAEIASYAREAMSALVQRGVVAGSSGKLDPLGPSTRAQMAQVLYNLLSR